MTFLSGEVAAMNACKPIANPDIFFRAIDFIRENPTKIVPL